MRRGSPLRAGAPQKPRKALPRLGKRGKEWEACKRKLKVRFERAGITSCELCGSAFALGFSHSLPRRYITTSKQLEEVALLCAGCHLVTDSHGHKVQFDTVLRIIDSRETAV